MKVINLDRKIFEKAYSLCSKDFEHNEIFNILKNSDDTEKQIAILKLKTVATTEEASMLVFHLTEHDGPVREAVALKLKELLLEKNCKTLDDTRFYPDYVAGVCDVNPNICRCIIDFLPMLNAQDTLLETILSKTEHIYQRIETPDKDQKNFLRVRIFNIYWCLEAIGTILKLSEIDSQTETRLYKILEKAITFEDYTIDEKVAQILAQNKHNEQLNSIKQKLKNADNFYVKRYFKDEKK